MSTIHRVGTLLSAALLTALLGCGATDMSKAPTTGCAAMRDTCIVNQHACVEDAGGPHCVPCPAGQYASKAGQCESTGANPLVHDFPMFTLMPGQEIVGTCRSWSLNNATELWVNAVELVQDEASHHSNWMYVPNTKYDGPDGLWNCGDRGYSQLTAALAGGVLYAQSTQASKEVQKFPNGAAVRIPPYSRIISDVHLLNASTQPVTGHAHLSIYTLAPADVKVKLVPFHLTYEGLDIPAHAQSRFYGDCDAGDSFYTAENTDWDAKVYYILPHTHKMARRFFLDVRGGPLDGKPLIAEDGFNSEARGRAYDPPIDLKGASGLHFGCEYDNQRDVNVKWGFGDQEMCEVLGFADTKRAFESQVQKNAPSGTDGAVQLFTSPCNTIMYPWDFQKPGGTPR